jgi:hypothetical protein
MNDQITIICNTVVFALGHVMRNCGYVPMQFASEYAVNDDGERIDIPLIEWAAKVNTWVSRTMGRMTVVITPDDQISFVLVALSVERLLSYCDTVANAEADPP